MTRTLFLLILSIVPAGFARELPRAAEAAAQEKLIRHVADSLQIQEPYVDAFLNNIGDDALLLASANELADDILAALEAREKFLWTRDLSESDFLRYVLPVRISGEPVQRYRRKLLNEIGEAVKSCASVDEAALEVNLWLGQRVTFRPTDRREQGVLTTLACGFGRCGEETILATAALRSVGIAARMAYVPFWAHQDNNHAWVEVKTGDHWSYLGACEPEAMLNHAWFDEPVLRAPILCARVSDVDSNEAGVVRGTRGWQVNSTANYFPPCRLNFEFPKEWSNKDELWFSVFNYGGFFPVARVAPNKRESSLDVGAGDFLLFGHYEEHLFVQEVHAEFGTEKVVIVNPSLPLPDSLICEFPLQRQNIERTVSEVWRLRLEAGRMQLEVVQREKNDAPDWLPDFAALGDSNLIELSGYLKNAPGNSRTLLNAYIAAGSERGDLLLELLRTLSEKDLREIDSLTLADALEGAETVLEHSYLPDDSLREYLISPRISWEAPRPWRVGLKEKTSEIFGETVFEKADAINSIVAARIGKVKNMRPTDPLTLWNAQTIDEKSALILACGMLRNAGVPAYITEGEEWVTFHNGKAWVPLYPSMPEEIGVVRERANAWFGEPATLKLTSPPKTKLALEESFNLMLIKDGWPDPYAEPILENVSTDSVASLKIVPGRYLLTWGLRNPRGDVKFGARELSVVAGQQIEEYLPLARPAEPVTQSAAEWRIPSELRRSLSLIDSGFTLVVVLAAQHEPSSRMLHAVGLIQNRSIDLVTLAGPDQEMDFESASKSVLESLQIPITSSEFREAAPFYRIIDVHGNVVASGNGYRLDMASVVAAAIH